MLAEGIYNQIIGAGPQAAYAPSVGRTQDARKGFKMPDKNIVEELLRAIDEFRQAFIIAVGDKSPFAKEALRRIDFAVALAAAQQANVADDQQDGDEGSEETETNSTPGDEAVLR